jgi:hypothetical protein
MRGLAEGSDGGQDFEAAPTVRPLIRQAPPDTFSREGRRGIAFNLVQASLPTGPGQSRLALRATARGGPQARP